ncbi:hypothetical protein D3C87_181190 [compost metagenome]
MRPIALFCLVSLLITGFSSCTFEREETDCIAYVKKNTMEPFSDFRVENNRVHLLGNRNRKLPAGDVMVSLRGSSESGLFVINYWRRMQQQEFKPEFDFSEVDQIDLLTAGKNYTWENDSVRVIYDQIMQDPVKKVSSCWIYFDLPAWSFEKLQHPETRVGFTRHFTQRISNNPMLLRYPFINTSRFVFWDLRKKRFLTDEDTVYVNCGGTGKGGYSYRKAGDLDVKILK